MLINVCVSLRHILTRPGWMDDDGGMSGGQLLSQTVSSLRRIRRRNPKMRGTRFANPQDTSKLRRLSLKSMLPTLYSYLAALLLLVSCASQWEARASWARSIMRERTRAFVATSSASQSDRESVDSIYTPARGVFVAESRGARAEPGGQPKEAHVRPASPLAYLAGVLYVFGSVLWDMLTGVASFAAGSLCDIGDTGEDDEWKRTSLK
ncbi:hypothetical protein VTO73DRAFT_3290 [Trametes versicolor]